MTNEGLGGSRGGSMRRWVVSFYQFFVIRLFQSSLGNLQGRVCTTLQSAFYIALSRGQISLLEYFHCKTVWNIGSIIVGILYQLWNGFQTVSWVLFGTCLILCDVEVVITLVFVKRWVLQAATLNELSSINENLMETQIAL